MELSDVDGVGPKTENRLKDYGIETIEQLSRADPDDIADNTNMSSRKAGKLVGRAEQEGIVIESGLEAKKDDQSKKRVPTGWECIDDILDGGWREGDLVGIYGTSGTGKTQTSFHSVTRCYEETGIPAVYIETERGRFSHERIKNLSNQDDTLENVYRIKAYSEEDDDGDDLKALKRQRLAYRKVEDAFDELSVIVVDSFTANFRVSRLSARENLPKRNRVMRDHLKTLISISKKLRCPVLLTLQIHHNPDGMSNKPIPWGGNLMFHMTNYLIYLRERGEVTIGQIENNSEIPETQFKINIGDEDLTASLDT